MKLTKMSRITQDVHKMGTSKDQKPAFREAFSSSLSLSLFYFVCLLFSPSYLSFSLPRLHEQVGSTLSTVYSIFCCKRFLSSLPLLSTKLRNVVIYSWHERWRDREREREREREEREERNNDGGRVRERVGTEKGESKRKRGEE